MPSSFPLRSLWFDSVLAYAVNLKHKACMKKIILSISYLFLTVALLAQDSQEPRPCATPSGKSAWLKKYQANPASFPKNLDTILYVPLTIHNVGTDNGSGYFPLDDVLDALCTLNEDFAASNIQFYIAGEIKYLARSDYYVHREVLDGADMMFENNVPNTLNCYIVQDPAGACGYNLPYGGVALRKSCISPNDHTWAHELGHALHLPHTFLGWEGGISYSDTLGLTHNYNDPAPTEVYYDYTYFKDTLIRDTLIIDTALVEYVDGRNCAIAADGFCDTPADYLYNRWNCSGTTSGTQQTDPDGVKFRSDGTLFMSYANDACQNRFSDGQIAAMRANLLDKKPYLLNQEEPQNQLPTTPLTLQSPSNQELVDFREVTFSWEAMPDADQYIFQVSRLPSFGFLEKDTLLTTNELTITDFRTDRTFYWRVRPYNSYSFCSPFSASRQFTTTTLTGTQDVYSNLDIQVLPNPVAKTDVLQLTLPSQNNAVATCSIVDITGRVIYKQQVRLNGNAVHISLAEIQLASGMYLVHFQSTVGNAVRKLVVN